MPKEFFLIIGIIVAILTVIAAIWWEKNRRIIKGKIGEKIVSNKLKKIKKSELIDDLTFSINENKTCQIDHILISERGIFVIETKTYAGRIYGDDMSLEWTQVLLYGKVKNKFYSPVKQNNTHIYELSKRINKNNMHNCVVFLKGDISRVKSNSVFTLKKLKKYILQQNIIFTEEEILAIKNSILALKEKISNKEHVKNIKQMKVNIEQNICPRCGKELVLRKGKTKDFYGCSGFPQCKFTKTK